MNYKEKMKLKGHSGVINKEVDKYFKDLGFEIDEMIPVYMNKSSNYDDLSSLYFPALKHYYEDNDGSYIRILISKKEIYIEIETPWGSFISSKIYKFKEDVTIEYIEEILEELIQ